MKIGVIKAMPNIPKNLSKKDLDEVETLAGLGMRFEDIALTKGMCLDTLKKYADTQLQRGKAKAKAQIMQTAYKMAASGKHPAMTMFWLKTQAQWRENQTPSADIPNLVDAIKGSDRPTQAIVAYLAETLDHVKQGTLDSRVASSIASVAGAFLKAVAQGDFEERLTLLETVTQIQPSSSLDLDI